MRRFAKLPPRWYGDTLGRAIRGNADLQALVPYLTAGPHSNAIGLYRLPLYYIVGDLGWSEECVRAALDKLVSLGFCRYDPEDEVIWILDGLRYEFERDLERDPTKGKPRQIPMVDSLIADVRDSPLTEEFLWRYGPEYPILLGWVCAPGQGQASSNPSPGLAPSQGQAEPNSSPKGSPKDSLKGSPKDSLKGSPNGSPNPSPEVAPNQEQAEPKGSPRVAPTQALKLPQARGFRARGFRLWFRFWFMF